MLDASVQYMFRTNILTVPGLDGSGPDHWQSLWEVRLPGCERVQMGDWAYPDRARWAERLDQAIRRSCGPVIIAAHGLGCLAVAAWASDHRSLGYQERVSGALLVTPPDLERGDVPERIASFAPPTSEPLLFPSLLVASRNDPDSSFAASARLAQAWGSRLVDSGHVGRLDAGSGVEQWDDGLRLLASLHLPDTDPLSPLWNWEPQSAAVAEPAAGAS